MEPLWAPALMMCIAVSAVVFALALLAARVASASSLPNALKYDSGCDQRSSITCVGKSRW